MKTALEMYRDWVEARRLAAKDRAAITEGEWIGAVPLSALTRAFADHVDAAREHEAEGLQKMLELGALLLDLSKSLDEGTFWSYCAHCIPGSSRAELEFAMQLTERDRQAHTAVANRMRETPPNTGSAPSRSAA